MPRPDMAGEVTGNRVEVIGITGPAVSAQPVGGQYAAQQSNRYSSIIVPGLLLSRLHLRGR